MIDLDHLVAPAHSGDSGDYGVDTLLLKPGMRNCDSGIEQSADIRRGIPREPVSASAVWRALPTDIRSESRRSRTCRRGFSWAASCTRTLRSGYLPRGTAPLAMIPADIRAQSTGEGADMAASGRGLFAASTVKDFRTDDD